MRVDTGTDRPYIYQTVMYVKRSMGECGDRNNIRSKCTFPADVCILIVTNCKKYRSVLLGAELEGFTVEGDELVWKSYFPGADQPRVEGVIRKMVIK